MDSLTPNADAVEMQSNGDSFTHYLRARIAALREDRSAVTDRLKAVIAPAERSNRDLTAAEAKSVRSAKSDAGRIDVLIRDAEARLAELEDIDRRHAEAAASRPRLPSFSGPFGSRTYEDRSDGPSFVADLIGAQLGDESARGRLARHQSEVGVDQRSATTGSFSGFVPPQYLTEHYAALARAGRPFVDRMPSNPLPQSGMSVVVSRITTGSTVASQATENATLSNTDMDDSLLTVPVITIGGQQVVSRQALERSDGHLDRAVFADLAFAFNSELDRQALNGTGASGEHLGVLNTAGITAVTYTDASPTVGELWPKLADAIGKVTAARHASPDVIVMHPRRWAWISAAVDTTGRPLVAPTDARPSNAMGVGDPAATGGVVGRIQGLDVIVDANVPTNLGAGTNEDVIIVCRSDDYVLWEDPNAPFTIRAEQPYAGSLGVQLVTYGYSAFTAGRYPSATVTIGGTGLVPPTL